MFSHYNFSFLLSAVLLMTSSYAFGRDPLLVGERVSNIIFTDIEGHQANLDQYADRIIILSVADRTSAQRLQEWMGPANLSLFKDKPDLRIAYVNIADVTGVPSLFRGFVRRVIKSLSRSAQKRLVESYQEHNIDLNEQQQVLHLIPDWKGYYLDYLGLDGAEEYACWVIHQGVVIASFTERTPNIKNQYVSVLKSLTAI